MSRVQRSSMAQTGNNKRSGEFSENVSLTEDGVFLVLESDLQTKKIREKHTIASLNRVGNELAFLVTETGTGSNDRRFEDLALGLFRKHNSSLGLNLGCESLNQDSVVERLECLQKISVLKASYGTEHDFSLANL
ncbi:hypothetical protein PMAYCL1PPCAC_12527, partial [Pristionchus mayeri]